MPARLLVTAIPISSIVPIVSRRSLVARRIDSLFKRAAWPASLLLRATRAERINAGHFRSPCPRQPRVENHRRVKNAEMESRFGDPRRWPRCLAAWSEHLSVCLAMWRRASADNKQALRHQTGSSAFLDESHKETVRSRQVESEHKVCTRYLLLNGSLFI